MSLQYVPAPATAFAAIRKLPAGCVLEVSTSVRGCTARSLSNSLVIPMVHVVAGLWLRGVAGVASVIVVGSGAHLGLLRVFGGPSRNLPRFEQNRA